ncbi:serine--tRNA ligase [Rickettsiales bacterium]|nr:serine--tRNA ligase [Rickettsiales bacterium]
MHNIKWIRENPTGFDKALEKRGLEPLSAKVIELDKQVRGSKTSLQELQQESNSLAKQIGQLKSKGENADEVIAKSKQVKEKLASLKEQIEQAEKGNSPLDELLSGLPNILNDDVPEGQSEDDNVEIRKWGQPRDFSFEPKEHFILGEESGEMDFTQSAKISGSRFSVLYGKLAKLQRALINFMMDVHTEEFGYMEVVPPLLVRDEAMFGSGQLPKFAEDSFETTNNYRLIPTAEVSLVNLVRESIIDQEQLPLRYVAYTPCFRSEAGSAGKDTRGMIRQHQFWKVELVTISDEDSGFEELERKTNCAETILQRLGLPYRVMLLCSKDTGFSSQKTYDLEVWLPGQNKYREISSCSNCGDFQGRRMKGRYRAGEKDVRFVHTQNGSGLAVGRTMVAILENYQQEDGTIEVPEVLKPYMGCDHI